VCACVCVCVVVCLCVCERGGGKGRGNGRGKARERMSFLERKLEHLTNCTKNATFPKSTKSRKSNFTVQIQIKPKSQFEFVPRDTEESEFLDVADFGDVAFSVESAIERKLEKAEEISKERALCLAF